MDAGPKLKGAHCSGLETNSRGSEEDMLEKSRMWPAVELGNERFTTRATEDSLISHKEVTIHCIACTSLVLDRERQSRGGVVCSTCNHQNNRSYCTYVATGSQGDENARASSEPSCLAISSCLRTTKNDTPFGRHSSFVLSISPLLL